MFDKIDSNVATLHIAEEESAKVLPGLPIWYEQEPNSYPDFGGDIATVSRNPINASRQRKKGVVVDLDASGGYNSDLTQHNMLRILQGFFFADAREKPATQSILSAAVVLTSVDSASKEYRAASGLGIFKVGHIVKASGFVPSGNNGLKVVATVFPGALTVAEALTSEAAPPAASKLEAVGWQFASGDVTAAVANGKLTLACTAGDFTNLGLIVGEWVFIGGDAAGEKFATCPSGYARVSSIATKALVFDQTTFAAVDDAGAGKTLRLFFGTVIRNEKDASLIKKRSYQLERQLGNDDNGVQSEYITGAFPNELTINVPQAEKITLDLGFVAVNNEFRNGTTGIKAGTRVAALGEEAFNTSSDIYRMKMFIVDPASLNPTALYAYISEINIAINNQITPNKAVGVLGAFDTSAGDFEVSGSLTAYFSNVAAVQAVRNNADVSFNLIAARENGGFVIDIPLIGLGGGRLGVEKDNPITLPLEAAAAENSSGYTLLTTWFEYLPAAAMPAA